MIQTQQEPPVKVSKIAKTQLEFATIHAPVSCSAADFVNGKHVLMRVVRQHRLRDNSEVYNDKG